MFRYLLFEDCRADDNSWSFDQIYRSISNSP